MYLKCKVSGCTSIILSGTFYLMTFFTLYTIMQIYTFQNPSIFDLERKCIPTISCYNIIYSFLFTGKKRLSVFSCSSPYFRRSRARLAPQPEMLWGSFSITTTLPSAEGPTPFSSKYNNTNQPNSPPQQSRFPTLWFFYELKKDVGLAIFAKIVRDSFWLCTF